MKCLGHHAQKGFSLIEIAVVLVVIGLILGGIFAGQLGLIQSGRTQDAMSIASDLSAAARDFKQRYHYLPGDFPIDATSPEIPGVSTPCVIGGANAGNGNGLIDAPPSSNDESSCLPEHLFRAGYIKGGIGGMKSAYGSVRVVANKYSNVATAGNPLPSRFLNIIEFANLPCDVAMDIDRKIDDGDLGNGNVRASVTTCVPNGPPVPFFAIGL